jgi:hypothetical protein
MGCAPGRALASGIASSFILEEEPTPVALVTAAAAAFLATWDVEEADILNGALRCFAAKQDRMWESVYLTALLVRQQWNAVHAQLCVSFGELLALCADLVACLA